MTEKLILMTVLAFALVACAGGDSAEDSGASTETTATATEDTTAGDGATDGTASGGGEADREAEGETVSMPEVTERKVIQTAAIAIEADDTRDAMAAIEDLVAAAGGFVQSAQVRETGPGTDHPTVDLVLRVPADDLAGALDAVADLGTRVISETQRGQDVTEEYVDVTARIENLSVLEAELQELLADVRGRDDTDPAKLLRVYDEISRVRGQIEQLEGRRRVLDDLTSLATLEVTITPTAVSAPVVEEGWSPLAVFKDSLRSLVAAGQWLVDAGIRTLVLFAPLLVVLVLLPWLGGRALWRRFRPSSPSPAATE